MADREASAVTPDVYIIKTDAGGEWRTVAEASLSVDLTARDAAARPAVGFASVDGTRFKLHLVIVDRGRLINACFTPGNVDDRRPVPKLTEALFGKLVADKGYISRALSEQLFRRGLHLVTRVKSNMRSQLMPFWDKVRLRKRAIIESVIDQLTNVCQVEHSRHRSPANYFAEVVAGLIAYTYRPALPSLNLRPDDLALAPAA